jgi:two-component system chemotaxis sensor kinase CheA
MSRRRDDARLAREFVAEAEEILERSSETLSSIEGSRDDTAPETINAFFRSIHSLKGLAGMVGLSGIADAAHAFEALLDAVRMGKTPLDDATLAAAAEGLAALSGLVKRVAAGELDPAPGSELVSRLQAAAQPRAAGSDGPPLLLPAELDTVVTDYERHRLEENRRKGRRVVALDLELPLETFDDGLRRAMAEASASGELVGTFPGASAPMDAMSFVLLVGLAADADPSAVAGRAGASGWREIVEPGLAALEPEAPTPPSVAPVAEPVLGTMGGTVRVPLEKIASLLDLAGELAIAKNALKRTVERAARETADRNLRHEMAKGFAALERSLAALSRAALATRLVPVDQLASRLARATRSIAPSLGKDVELEVVGGETELDKVLADELADPLLHIVRNAIGHGLETPEERTRAGKPPKGRVTVSAETRGRDVAISIADDGRGIDPVAVVARAQERGLLAEGRVPGDPLSVIFLPGFSTAAEVSELSGRGVGLDVVRSRIAALEGAVSVRSVVGEGTTFEIVVPITLALVESLLVEDGGITFAFPGTSIARTLWLEPERVSGPAGHEVIRDEDGPVPIAPLAALLGIPAKPATRGKRTVVVAERGTRRAGFVVNGIGGLLDLIVKPLPPAIARAPEITGAAELPDGQLALTLDAALLVERVLAREAVV